MRNQSAVCSKRACRDIFCQTTLSLRAWRINNWGKVAKICMGTFTQCKVYKMYNGHRSLASPWTAAWYSSFWPQMIDNGKTSTSLQQWHAGRGGGGGGGTGPPVKIFRRCQKLHVVELFNSLQRLCFTEETVAKAARSRTFWPSHYLLLFIYAYCLPTAAMILIKKYIWVRIWIAKSINQDCG